MWPYLNFSCDIFTGQNEVLPKVMFLHLCVILFTGGVPDQAPSPDQGGTPPDQAGTPQDQTPPDQGGTPPRPGRNPPGPGKVPPWDQTPQNSRLWNTVNIRPVRILLECILVEINSGTHLFSSSFLVSSFCHCYPHVVNESNVIT